MDRARPAGSEDVPDGAGASVGTVSDVNNRPDNVWGGPRRQRPARLRCAPDAVRVGRAGSGGRLPGPPRRHGVRHRRGRAAHPGAPPRPPCRRARGRSALRETDERPAGHEHRRIVREPEIVVRASVLPPPPQGLTARPARGPGSRSGACGRVPAKAMPRGPGRSPETGPKRRTVAPSSRWGMRDAASVSRTPEGRRTPWRALHPAADAPGAHSCVPCSGSAFPGAPPPRSPRSYGHRARNAPLARRARTPPRHPGRDQEHGHRLLP
jgi:hypothetical protein